MKRLFIILAVTLSLGGCANLGKVAEFVTTGITNPVGAVNIYQAKNVYASALEIAAGYREYCWSRAYAALMADPVAKPICQNRRPIMRTIQDADNKAFAAIQRAENFVRNNPTLNASAVINEALAAVSAFQSITSRTAVALASK